MLCIHFPLVTWIGESVRSNSRFSLILTSLAADLFQAVKAWKSFVHTFSPSLFTLHTHTHITVFSSLNLSLSLLSLKQPAFSLNFLCFRMFMLSWTHHRCHWSNHFDRIGSGGVIESRLVQHEHNGWEDGVRELVRQAWNHTVMFMS